MFTQLKKAELIHIEHHERYDLGKIRLTIPEFQVKRYRLKDNRDVFLFADYKKITPSQVDKEKIVLGEHLNLQAYYQTESSVVDGLAEYFTDHPIYSGSVSKLTKEDGTIFIECRDRLQKRTSLDIKFWDKGIIDALKTCPKHVRKVIEV